jgi:peroxiredoxin
MPKYERERTKRIFQRLTNAEIELKVKQYELWARSKKQVCHRRYNETIIDWAETTLRLSQLRAAREFYERRLEFNSQSEVPMATLKIVSALQQFSRHTLKYELDHAVAMLGDLYPEDELQRMFGEIRLLKRSGIEQLALQVGDLTDFRLRANSGKWIDSSKLRSQGRLIVTFYHSCGSSLCMVTLRALQKYQKTFESEGAKLLAISPESHESTKTSASKSGAKFPLLSDTNCQIANAFGLTYKMEAALPGNLHPRLLPMTATYVIDTDGTILYKFVNCDHTKRAEPTKILEALPMTECKMRRGLFSRIRGGPGS